VHRLRGAIDSRNRLAEVAFDLMGVIPSRIMRDDLIERLLACQHRRQHDAVVISARLRSKKGNVETFTVSFE
jgi:hypothetical protein